MNTAKANNSHAKIAFFLLFVLVKILDNSSSITANAQGFILSANAAGNIIHRNLNLFLFSDICAVDHEITISSLSSISIFHETSSYLTSCQDISNCLLIISFKCFSVSSFIRIN